MYLGSCKRVIKIQCLKINRINRSPMASRMYEDGKAKPESERQSVYWRWAWKRNCSLGTGIRNTVTRRDQALNRKLMDSLLHPPCGIVFSSQSKPCLQRPLDFKQPKQRHTHEREQNYRELKKAWGIKENAHTQKVVGLNSKW